MLRLIKTGFISRRCVPNVYCNLRKKSHTSLGVFNFENINRNKKPIKYNIFNKNESNFKSNLGSSPQVRWLCSPPKPDITVLAVYEDIIKETLESLSEHVEYLLESQSQIEEWDVTLSDGVLTVKLNEEHGTYVINKQTPNRQIWLSSPISGPKRFDFTEQQAWVYHHTGENLHTLLSQEFSSTLQKDVDFHGCSFSGTHS